MESKKYTLEQEQIARFAKAWGIRQEWLFLNS
mgnify:FL=1